jgi:hypothetical protein
MYQGQYRPDRARAPRVLAGQRGVPPQSPLNPSQLPTQRSTAAGRERLHGPSRSLPHGSGRRRYHRAHSRPRQSVMAAEFQLRKHLGADSRVAGAPTPAHLGSDSAQAIISQPFPRFGRREHPRLDFDGVFVRPRTWSSRASRAHSCCAPESAAGGSSEPRRRCPGRWLTAS